MLANEEAAKENCPTASCNRKVSGDFDAGLRTISHRHSDSDSVYRRENGSAQHLRRSLPPVPLSVVSEKECLDHAAEQIATSAVDDADSEPLIFPKEPVTSHHNGLEVVDSQVHAIKEGSTIQKRDSIRRSNLEGHYAAMKTSIENRELGEIYEDPGYEESKNSEFCSENRPSTSTGKCKTPSDSDLTYMCINAEQSSAGPVNNGPDLMEDTTERNLVESECLVESESCTIYDGNANGITEKIAQNLTGVKNLEPEDWNKENGADDVDPTSYAGACMTQKYAINHWNRDHISN